MSDISLAEVVDPSGPGNRRRTARAAERRRKRRHRRTWVSVLIGLLVIGAAVSIAWFTIRPVIASFSEPKDWTGPGSGEVTVTIAQGSTGTAIGQILQKAGVVKTVTAFVDAAAENDRSAQIQPGVYSMKRQMSGAGAVAILVDPANRLVDKVTIKEGKRLVEIVDTLAKGMKIPKADFEAALKNPAQLGLPTQAKGLAEGWLFPATYEVTPTTTARSLLGEMVQRTIQELTDLQVPEAKWHQTIVTASLVEAESGSVADAPKIARVLANRLAKPIRLQLDTTLNYALGRYKVGVTTKDTQYASPYNTYLHDGIPPGAICSPGAAAIKAVLNPTPGPWLYFVAVDPSTGLTKYGVTPADFAALQAELNAWLKAHPGQ